MTQRDSMKILLESIDSISNKVELYSDEHLDLLLEERNPHDTIKHLLALADRPGNEAEGVAARAAAQRLAKTYAIDIDSLSGKVGNIGAKSTKPRTASTKSTEPYTGPFPRKKHSHKCPGARCRAVGNYNPVGCYKKNCTLPKVTLCPWCRQGDK